MKPDSLAARAIALALLVVIINAMIWFGLAIGKHPEIFPVWLSLFLAQGLGAMLYVLCRTFCAHKK